MLKAMPTTMRNRQLGEQLKGICKRANLTTRAIGPHLREKGLSQSQVSRFFTGTRRIGREDLVTILTLAKATPAETDYLLRLHTAESEPGISVDGMTWLALRAADRKHQMLALMAAEDFATVITHFAALVIPGVLQTGDYARAIYLADGVPVDEARLRVAERIGRREILERRENPVSLKAFIHEGVLRSIFGSAEIMRDQIRHLVAVSSLDNITLRVVPFAAGYNPLHSGQCSVIESPDAEPVVHQDFRGVGLFVEEPSIVSRTMQAMERLKEVSLSPDESVEFMTELIENMEMAV